MQFRTNLQPLAAVAFRRLALLVALLLVLGGFVEAAAADSSAVARLDSWRAELDQSEAALLRPSLDDSALAALRDRVEAVRIGARGLATDLARRVQALQAELGTGRAPVPDPSEKPGSDPVQIGIGSEATLLSELEGLLRQARTTVARADDIGTRITERRRSLRMNKILARSPSLLDPSLWSEVIRAVPAVGYRLSLLASDWWRILESRGVGPAVGAVVLAILFACTLLGPGRHLLLRFRLRDQAAEAPSLHRKAVSALWVALVNAAVPTVSVGLVFLTLQTFGLVPMRVESALPGLVLAIGFTSLMAGLTRGILVTGKPNWRLIHVSEDVAERLSLLLLGIAGAAALAIFGGVLLELVFAPPEVLAAWRGVFSLAIAISVMVVLRMLAGRLVRPDEHDEGGLPFPWSLVVPVFWLAATAAVAASAAGFGTLGPFILGQLLWTSTLLGLLFLLLVVIEGVFSATFRSGTRLGLALSRSMGIAGTRVEQIGVVLSGVVRLLLIIVAGLLALAPYGVESGDVLGWLDRIFTGISIGEITVSFSAILAALALFLIGVLATRGVQRWLDTQLLPRTRMDAGIRNSVKTGVGYAGLILAAAIACSSLGLSLSNVAIVAGALSIGIGFGLQSIVNNFVSGLILLAERPIKTGDWIVVGAEQGLVKRISVRATEIETFDRASVIIPNSDLISGVVKNWVHGDRTGRIIINVGVSYESDAEQVRDILLECARSHPSVLTVPEPRAFFLGFGESSLDFQLFCFLGDVSTSLSVKSDLHFAILGRLREAGIEIPFRQSDVTIRNVAEVAATLRAIGNAQPTRKAGSRRADERALVDA